MAAVEDCVGLGVDEADLGQPVVRADGDVGIRRVAGVPSQAGSEGEVAAIAEA